MTPLILAAAMMGQSLGSSTQAELSTKETRSVTHAYAECVVKRQPKRAAEAIRANLDNTTILRNYPQLLIGDCLRTKPSEVLSARFTGDLYRYALADALVRRELAGFDPESFASLPKLDHHDPGAPPAVVDAKGKKLSARKFREAVEAHRTATAFAYLSRYGECVVRNAPDAARELLFTAPDSAEEGARFKAMSLALATCLPEGETLKFGRTTLRGTIAINYYRLAMAARPAATGTAG